MAATPTNTVTSLNTKGIREDLENNLYRVAPEEVPFTSTIGKTKAKQHYHQWQVETIDAPNVTPTQYLGADAQPEAGTASSQIGNYAQHFERSFQVATVMGDITLAGRTSEMNRQTVLKGLALKRDIEKRALGNYASAPEVAGTTPYTTAGALAFCTTSTNRGTGGVNGGFSSGVVSAATNGAQRTFTEAMLKSSLNQVFTASGSMADRVAFMSPTQKQTAAAFTGLVQNRRETGSKKAVIVGGADVYVSDFGEVTFVPSIFCSQRDVLIIDPDMWALASLRDITTEDLAKTGDSDKRMIVADKAVVARNEASAAVIADLL